jgi:hypothetical protein
MDKATPGSDVFKTNLDRAVPCLAKLASYRGRMETKHVSLARGTRKIQRLGV